MPRPIWKGSINFGLVSVPVGLYSATGTHTIAFHQVERGTSDRVRYQRVNERTGKQVAYEDIVKGRDVGGGEYVVVEPEELAEVAPGRSESLDIEAFVDAREIDPIYYQRTYWLAPAQQGSDRPYALLVKAIAETNRAGVGVFVMRGKEYLCAIRAAGPILQLNTMFFADEVREPAEQFEDLPDLGQVKGKELKMAESLVESMTQTWDPEDYRDTYTEAVEQLVEDKRNGHETVTAAQPSEPTNVVDLSDALQRSLDSRRGSSSKRGSRGETDLSELTKPELAQMARELDISGRSKMSRAELEQAVTDASRGQAAS